MIGRCHFVRHILPRQFGQRIGGGNFHFVIDGPRPHVQRPPENIGESQNVVDLIGIVRTPRRNDHITAHGMRILRRDFRVRIGHGENDRVLGHALDHFRRERTCHGKPEEHISPLHGIFQRAVIRINGVGRFPLVHAFGTTLVDHAF